MAKRVNILLLVFALWQIVYYLFGKPDSKIWGHAFYIIESGFVLYVFWLISDWTLIKKWLLWLVASVYIIRICTSIVGLFSNNAFEYLNKNYLLCFMLACGVELLIILNRKR